MKSYLILAIIISSFSCASDSCESETEERWMGSYKNSSGAHFEVLNLEQDQELSSTYSSRGYLWEEFDEKGHFKINGDTLFIHRTRHEVLRLDKYPEEEKFLIRGDALLKIDSNIEGEEFVTTTRFEKVRSFPK